MDTTNKKQCPQCKNWIPKDAEKCNYCGYDPKFNSQEQSRTKIIKTAIIFIIVAGLITFAISFFLKSNNFQEQSGEDLAETVIAYLPYIIPMIIVFFVMISIITAVKKVSKSSLGDTISTFAKTGVLPQKTNTLQQLNLTQGKIKCKNCGHEGNNKEFYQKNWFIAECPGCKTGDKLYTIVNNREVKVSKYGRILVIIFIIIFILFIFLD